MAHDKEDVEDGCQTVIEPVDMEITSELESGTIETNIPLSPTGDDGEYPASSSTRLVAEDYLKTASVGLEKELHYVHEKQFICSISKLRNFFLSAWMLTVGCH